MPYFLISLWAQWIGELVRGEGNEGAEPPPAAPTTLPRELGESLRGDGQSQLEKWTVVSVNPENSK